MEVIKARFASTQFLNINYLYTHEHTMFTFWCVKPYFSI